MSETLPQETYEQQVDKFEHLKELGTGEALSDKRETETRAAEIAEPLIKSVEARQDALEASTGEDSKALLNQLEKAVKEPEQTLPTTVSSQMKSITKRRELKQLQQQEKLPVRSFSKVVHQRAVQVVSDGAGKTISRPSGLLGGSLAAFIGGGTYYILAKYFGFTYNYSVALALFVGGFILGLVLELLVHMASSSSRQQLD